MRSGSGNVSGAGRGLIDFAASEILRATPTPPGDDQFSDCRGASTMHATTGAGLDARPRVDRRTCDGFLDRCMSLLKAALAVLTLCGRRAERAGRKPAHATTPQVTWHATNGRGQTGCAEGPFTQLLYTDYSGRCMSRQRAPESRSTCSPVSLSPPRERPSSSRRVTSPSGEVEKAAQMKTAVARHAPVFLEVLVGAYLVASVLLGDFLIGL